MAAEQVIAEEAATRGRPRFRLGADRRWLVAPALLVLTVGYLLPLATVVPQALTGSGPGLGDVFGESLYRTVIWTTVRISLITTVLTLVVSYPFAWLISRARGRRRTLLILLVLLPFLTSVLVRTFSWIVILGKEGFVNRALHWLGIVDAPVNLLFSTGSVVVALVHVSIPLMIFSLVTVMNGVEDRTLMVARSLGASRVTAYLRVLVPLTLPGIRSGCTLVFLYSMASFIAPAVLGGRDQTMLAQVIQSEIESGYDWKFAAVLGIALAITAVVAVGVLVGLFGRLTRWMRPRPVRTSGRDRRGQDWDVLRTGLPRRVRIGGRLLRLAGRVLMPAYLTVFAVFVLIPLVVLVPTAFTSDDTLVFPPRGLSLTWFHKVVSDPSWAAAALTSLRIGVVAALAATALAQLLVLGLGQRGFRGQAIISGLVMAPISVPAVVFAVGAYLAYARVFTWTGHRFRLTDTEAGIVLAHTVLVLPLAFLIIAAVYAGIDQQVERAAASLGAPPWTVMWRITLPLMTPGLAVSMLLCFLQSFDESVVSIFLSGLRVTTLPRRLWDGVRSGTSPEVAAVSVLLMALTCVMLTLVSLVLVRARHRAAALNVGRRPLR